MFTIADVSNNKTLESTVLKIFERLELKMNRSNVEDSHWITSKNSFKRVVVKVSRRKDASKTRSSKKNLKDMDLISTGINNLAYINDSLCMYL